MSAFTTTRTVTPIVLGIGLVAGSASAGSTYPDFLMTWYTTADTQGAVTYDPADFGGVTEGPGSWNYIGDLAGDNWLLSWDCTVAPGGGAGVGVPGTAFVNAAITVTNNSLNIETFSVLMSLGAGPIGPITDLSGSVGATVTNNQFGGSATLGAPAGDSVYHAYIDYPGSPVATLWDAGYSLTATGPFASNSDSDGFAAPGAGGPVTSNIAILLQFTLSPGDTASVNGIFTVTAVPAPTALSVLGMAFFGLNRRRRRA
ncbi:MAG: hypothetical protein KF817_11165 [Phycisphaeraceae bacterium]|nr:hypothetical protein [Phycisphaeraceae bacterium]